MNLNERDADNVSYFYPDEEELIFIPEYDTSQVISECDRMIALLSKSDPTPATKIFLDSKLLLNYIFAPTALVDRSLHDIVRSLLHKEIICYVIKDELERAFEEITSHQISEYASRTIGYDLAADHQPDNLILSYLDPDSSIDTLSFLTRQRFAVITDIKQRIERDFEIVDIDEDLNKAALALELRDTDLAIKIAYFERNKLTAIVTTATLPEWYRLNINIFSPASFIEYKNNLSGASDQIQSENNRSNTNLALEEELAEFPNNSPESIEVLNELAGFPNNSPESIYALNKLAGFPSNPPEIENIAIHFGHASSLHKAALPQIGKGWFFGGFEVYSTARLLVSSTLILEDRKHEKKHTFIGKGNGMISALLNAVDNAVTYLFDNGIVKQKLPTAKNIALFNIVDCDRDVNAPVICTIIFSHQNKLYYGSGEHTDTVKSALLAYATALEAVVKGNDKIPDRPSIEGVIVASKCKKGFRDFSNQDYRNIRLIDHALNSADFSNSDLRNSTIAECKLAASVWTAARLSASKLTNNDFTDANLFGVYFTDSVFIANNFTSSNLMNANFTNSTFTANDFTDANLFGSIFTKAIAKYCDFVNTIFQKAILIGAVLVGSNFSYADFTHADLENANLTNAVLTNANLTGANLTNANLTGANLTNANLLGANLLGTNLDHANLMGANFTKANLVGTNLANTNVGEATLTDTILDPIVVTPESNIGTQLNPNSAGVNL